ncbi:cytochrome P450 6k1-like [Melitaea cinxia]|uniref:cytochrome P450 6k1-like n=1 Tax=Melitaea cinxia TaxID=113334 RepID=UPI001E270644|nr:cytochrome P450 6k1-like [Melitaea cinxia]
MLQQYMLIKSKELVRRIHNDRNILIDLKKMYVDYTTDVIGTSAFGVKSDATLTRGGPLREITEDFSKYDMYRNFSWYSLYFFPELADIFRFKFFPRLATDYFRKIFRAVASQRETNQIDEKAKDLLDFLLKIQKQNDSYSDDLIISQAAIFLLGGYESCATLLTYTTYELAHLPELQDKVYRELLEATKSSKDGNIDTEVLAELTYLNCVVKEGLRKYMTLTWLDRVTDKEYKIDDKVTLEPGTVVYINIIGIQYDPQYFPEPNKFDPDRFLPENKHTVEQYSYLPFGEGPRACIGKRFGLMTAQFALASLLLNYKIQPAPNTPRPEDVKIDNRGLLYLPADSLHVSFVPRC